MAEAPGLEVRPSGFQARLRRVPALWLGRCSEGLGSCRLLKGGWVTPVVFQTFLPESCVQIKSYKKMQINIIHDSRVGLVLSGGRNHPGRIPTPTPPPLKSHSFETAGWFKF